MVGTLRAVGALTHLGAQRPEGVPARRGPCFLYKKAGGKNRRGFPPAPPGIKPLAGARSIFWVGRRSRAVAGLFRGPPTGPDLETFFWKNIFGLDFCVPRPKPSPWGEGGPAQPGRMRGRPGTQRSRRKPAYRRQAIGHWFSTRKGFGGIAPSSVCFADSFPPRGSRSQLQVCHPYPVCTKRLPQPAQPGGGPLPTLDAGPQARKQKKGDTPKDIPNQSGESRGEKLSPLVFFPPFLT